MLRLKRTVKPDDMYLALPDAEPVTLLQVSSENLPYACQCPLCGGIFDIPKGILYKIEDDGIDDIDSGSEANGTGGMASSGDAGGFFEENMGSPPTQDSESDIE